jgi:hypothetical protein
MERILRMKKDGVARLLGETFSLQLQADPWVVERRDSLECLKCVPFLVWRSQRMPLTQIDSGGDEIGLVPWKVHS